MVGSSGKVRSGVTGRGGRDFRESVVGTSGNAERNLNDFPQLPEISLNLEVLSKIQETIKLISRFQLSSVFVSYVFRNGFDWKN